MQLSDQRHRHQGPHQCRSVIRDIDIQIIIRDLINAGQWSETHTSRSSSGTSSMQVSDQRYRHPDHHQGPHQCRSVIRDIDIRDLINAGQWSETQTSRSSSGTSSMQVSDQRQRHQGPHQCRSVIKNTDIQIIIRDLINAGQRSETQTYRSSSETSSMQVSDQRHPDHHQRPHQCRSVIRDIETCRASSETSSVQVGDQRNRHPDNHQGSYQCRSVIRDIDIQIIIRNLSNAGQWSGTKTSGTSSMQVSDQRHPDHHQGPHQCRSVIRDIDTQIIIRDPSMQVSDQRHRHPDHHQGWSGCLCLWSLITDLQWWGPWWWSGCLCLWSLTCIDEVPDDDLDASDQRHRHPDHHQGHHQCRSVIRDIDIRDLINAGQWSET